MATRSQSSYEIRHKNYVLVVEKDGQQRQKTCHLIQSLGYRTYQAQDGESAYRILNEHYDTIDDHKIAIISDLKAPVEDGITLLQDLRANDYYKDLPFICMIKSNEVEEEEEESPMNPENLGASAVIPKPLKKEKVAKVLEDLLIKSHAA